MDWLSSIKKAPTPKTIAAFDPEFQDLVSNWMLVANKETRKTCAECLNSPYLSKSRLHHSKTNPLNKSGDAQEDACHEMPREGSSRKIRHRVEDHSLKALHTGSLYKLNSGADPKDASAWLQRDMWLANNGSLCYFSKKDNKRLVLLDGGKLHHAEVTPVRESARDNAFKIQCKEEEEDFTFAAAAPEELAEWMRLLQHSSAMDAMPTVRLGRSFGMDLKNFMLSVRNRRMKIENDDDRAFEPVFEGTIWKLKSSGDPMKDEDWFPRKTKLTCNGSLVYWSVRDNRELIYYTSADVHRAEVMKTPSDQSAKPWSFEVNLPACEGMEFQKGVFAGESEEMRERWIQEFAKFKV
jgi:hypothetical protein